jgi:predicted transcriptional regulator
MNAETPSHDDGRGSMLPIHILALLIEAPDGLDTEQISRKVKRDYDADPEREEVTTALDRLVKKNLICRDGERWRSTPAALKAHVLSV